MSRFLHQPNETLARGCPWYPPSRRFRPAIAADLRSRDNPLLPWPKLAQAGPDKRADPSFGSAFGRTECTWLHTPTSLSEAYSEMLSCRPAWSYLLGPWCNMR